MIILPLGDTRLARVRRDVVTQASGAVARGARVLAGAAYDDVRATIREAL